MGEQRFVELAVEKRIGTLLPIGRLDDAALRTGALIQTLRPADGHVGLLAVCCDPDLHALTEQGRAHKMALAFTRLQIAFVCQLLVGQYHGDATHAQLEGQLAAGRHGRTGLEVPAQNGRDEHLLDLALQRQVFAGAAL